MSEAHVHEWEPNGIAELHKVSRSPGSTWDDLLWTQVVSVQVCRCGKVRRVGIGTKNRRRRGDDLRKASRRFP